MNDNWQQMSLGEFVTFQRGHDLPDADRKVGTIPVIGSFGITGYHNTARAKGPGVTVGRSGASFGQVTFSPVDFWPHNACLYVKDFHGNDEKFAYYFLKSMDFSSFNSGSAQPSLNRNHIHPIPVKIPPPPEQRTIAHILGTLDDKIELNRRINAELEAIARTIYKSWFVDFDPVRAKMRGEQPEGMDAEIAALFPDMLVESELGDIPTGWKTRTLYDSASYINGAAYKNIDFSPDQTGLPVIKIAELKNGITSQTKFTTKELPEKYFLNNGDILFSWSGSPDTSIDTFIWLDGPAWLNQHIFRVVPRTDLEKPFIYLLLRYLKPVFIEIARDKQTTGLGHVTMEDMKRILCLLPAQNVLEAFNDCVDGFIKLIIENEFQISTLTELRDTLLPKLVSGQIRVEEAEKLL